MAKFTAQEVTALQEGGNEVTYLLPVFLVFYQFHAYYFLQWFCLTCSVLEKYFSRIGILNAMDTLTAGYLLFLVIPSFRSQHFIFGSMTHLFLVSVMLID